MIEIHDLRKRYRKKEALKGVSFSLSTGITGLLGPNGAGKTTLLRCMLGILKPTGGEIAFVSDERERRQAIGYLPQKYGLLRELRVGECLEYFAMLKEVAAKDVQRDIDECLRRVNLADSMATKVGDLSGGMMRRVGIAAALLGGPSVLVFDEPTAGLDPEERVRFKRLVSELSFAHAVLISTHIVEDIEAVASKVIVLDDGLVRAAGSLQDIADLAAGKCFHVPREYVNEYSDDYYVEKYVDVDGVALARVLSCRQYEGFSPTAPTVEDGYLAVTRGLA